MGKPDRCAAKAAYDPDYGGGSVGNKDEEGTRDVAGAPHVPEGARLTMGQRRYT